MDLRVTAWPIDKPIPYSRNARKISSKAIDKVAASIKEFGFRQPIVVDRESVIIAGHTRLLAAQKLGLREVPVHVAEGLTPSQVKAYRIMDNRSHEETEWDFELLGPEIQELKDLDVDLVLTGFDARELEGMLADPAEDEKANAVPETPKHDHRSQRPLALRPSPYTVRRLHPSRRCGARLWANSAGSYGHRPAVRCSL